MKPRSVLTRINRIVLALTGLVLLGGGLLVLAASLDLYRRWHLTPPADWPLTSPHDILISSADRTRWSSQGWWWWTAVIAALAIVLLLALWWLIAQLRRSHPGAVRVGGTPPLDDVELRDRALSDAITAEALGLRDVEEAEVRITGSSRYPRNRVDLTLSPRGAPLRVLHELCEGPLGNARRSTGADDLPTEVRLRVARHKAQRAE